MVAAIESSSANENHSVMRPHQRTALVCSAKHWTSPVHLSAHHIAKFLLARGWRVAFLSNPTSLFHLARYRNEEATLARFRNWRLGGEIEHDGKLFHYTPLTILPPSRVPGLGHRLLFDNWVHLTAPSLIRFLDRRGFARPDIMITESALMAPLWKALGQPRLVYRVTDRNDDFPNMPSPLRELERRMAKSAEMVVVTGDRLLDYVKRLGPQQTLLIPNGVETEHFSSPHPIPAEYASIPAPRAVFVGTIAEWFDPDLVMTVARALPNVSFVIIGPGKDRIARIGGLANVHVLGPRPYASVPAYMQHADIGLIPFSRIGMEDFVDDINPLKLYEYMAAGLPVVSTPIGQAVASGAPMHVAKSAAEFAEAVRGLTGASKDASREREFAASFDWSRQLVPLAERLGL